MGAVENYVTVVLDNTALAAVVCGPYDGNLRALEAALGRTVSVRGNEVRVEGLDAGGAARFRSMMDALVTAAREGDQPSPEYVKALADVEFAPADGSGSAGLEQGGAPSPLRADLITIPGGFRKVFPKTANQRAYIQGLRSCDIAFCVGPAGTGKTYLAVAYALSLVLTKKARKLLLTRPVVEAGESLGFLPGDLAQKINPYLRPLYDAMESLIPYEAIRRMEENRVIEIAPLAYMRGRSLNEAVIILDEAQNTTKEQMKMFLTRLGAHSRAVVTGDTTQIDLPKRVESGLLHALGILRPVEGIHFSYLNTADVVRNPLIKRIIEAYDRENYAQKD